MHMRELRIQHRGDPYRVLYAFDPRRVGGILLIGGTKGGDNRWYEKISLSQIGYMINISRLYERKACYNGKTIQRLS